MRGSPVKRSHPRRRGPRAGRDGRKKCAVRAASSGKLRVCRTHRTMGIYDAVVASPWVLRRGGIGCCRDITPDIPEDEESLDTPYERPRGRASRTNP